MRSAASPAVARDADGMRATLERFLKSCQSPCLLEPGEELLPLTNENLSIECKENRLTIQAWSDTRNVMRRIVGLGEERRGRLELVVERFARHVGQMVLIDMARPESQETGRRGGRMVFRERFRSILTREFPSWKLTELSADPDLEHSLSPAFPRAFLRGGNSGMAAIAAPPEGMDAGFLLSFGLIWLDYLRRREKKVAIERLVLFLPAGAEQSTCHRLPYLDPNQVRCDVMAYSPEDFAVRRDPRDYGNLDTKLETFRRASPEAQGWVDRLKLEPEVERVANNNGTVSLRVHGVEFARTSGNELLFGLRKRAAAREHNLAEIETLASELISLRSSGGDGLLYRQHPEEWLASQVRANIDRIDAGLRTSPVYSQAPACLGGQRGLIDLLAVDYSGRLAVLELKASQDIHLPLQALDYWMRVKWHLERDEFTSHGYFPGIELRKEPPKVLLISPSLEFHPTSETILQFLSPQVEVERIGVGVHWREKLQVMFRMRGAEQPF
jgi:hypothetical protein